MNGIQICGVVNQGMGDLIMSLQSLIEVFFLFHPLYIVKGEFGTCE